MTGAEATTRRTDEGDRTGNSQLLLQNVIDNPLDEDYYLHEPSAPTRGGRILATAAVAGLAVLLTVAALQTKAAEPENRSERDFLLAQIDERKSDIREQREAVASLSQSVDRLRREQSTSQAQAQLRAQGAIVGTVAVAGPGLRVTVDSAKDADDHPEGRVRDKDLQLLVNGLWQAGAEAIAINDNRLTALSPIRGAGEGITVNYRSLTTPYVVTAIGSPRTLPGNFAETAAAQSWSGLKENLGMRFDIRERESLRLPAAPERATSVRNATVLEGGAS